MTQQVEQLSNAFELKMEEAKADAQIVLESQKDKKDEKKDEKKKEK